MLAETVIQLLIMALILLIMWSVWLRFSPYLKFPCYFWFPFDLFHWFVLSKRRKNVPFGSFLLQELIHISKKFEDEGICVLWLDRPILLVYGEEAAKFLSNETLTDKAPEYKMFDDAERFSSVFLSNGEKWRKERRMITPAFKSSVIKELVPAMNEHAAGLVEELRHFGNETVHNTIEHVKIYSMLLFYESVIGMTTDVKERKNIARRMMEKTEELLEIVVKRMFNFWLHLDFAWNMSPLSKKYTNCIEEMIELGNNRLGEWERKIASKIQTADTIAGDPELCKGNYKSILQILMELHMKDPSSTNDDFFGQMFTIITAGYDTASRTLTWILWLLGQHEDIQEKAYDEILSSTNKYLEFDDTRKLIYLECIIKEGLRLYPVVPVFGRSSSQDISFGKYKIPKRTSVWFFPYVLHRNAKTYPDPEVFNPDRFLSIDCNKSPWTFMPFAEGARSCIGKNFAMLELKIFLAHLLRSFKVVSLDRREDIIESWEILLKSATPLRMKFLPR